MLLGFSFENFASFYNEAIFTMYASKKDEFRDLNTFDTSYGGLLKSALIFGPNGSGKTNWLNALMYMQQMVIANVINKNIIRDNEVFKFFKNSCLKPTIFEISFIQSKIMYEYGFKIFKDEIIGEWLYRKIRRKTPVFYRDSSSVENIKLFGEMKKAEKIKEFIRKDSLFLTTAAMFNIDIAEEIIAWFNNVYILEDSLNTPGYTMDFIEKDHKNKEKILKQLKIADITIDDFKFEIKDTDIDGTTKERLLQISRNNLKLDDRVKVDVRGRSIDLKTKHKIYDENKDFVDDIELSFIRYQSRGTIKFFELLGPILDSLESGKVIVIDEIDSRLHTGIVTYIVKLFNSIDRNPNNGQLICNTHNVLLLDEDIRRDQIWFIQKDKYGESELYSLDDFNGIRKDDPRLKKYLLGVYDAVPDTDRGDILV